MEPKRVPLLVRLTELRKDPNATNHQLNDADRPVTVKEAARFLGVSPSLVYEYVSRKQIPHHRMMGRCIRFRLSELVGRVERGLSRLSPAVTDS